MCMLSFIRPSLRLDPECSWRWTDKGLMHGRNGCRSQTGDMDVELKRDIKQWEVNKKQSFSTWSNVHIMPSSLTKKINWRKSIGWKFTCHRNLGVLQPSYFLINYFSYFHLMFQDMWVASWIPNNLIQWKQRRTSLLRPLKCLCTW